MVFTTPRLARQILFFVIVIISIEDGVESFVMRSNKIPSCQCPISLAHLPTLLNHLQASSSFQDDPRFEPRILHQLTLPLPMGLVLEEMDISETSYGVVVVGMTPGGNASVSNRNLFASMRSYGPDDAISNKCICIRDKIMAVNGKQCHDKSLEFVMDLILQSESDSVSLDIGRIEGSTILCYSSSSDNEGVCIAAKRGESYGFLAQKCGVDVEYSCRTGNCLTCQRWMEIPSRRDDIMDGRPEDENGIHVRTILNCVGTVPRGYDWLHVLGIHEHMGDGVQ